MSISLTAKIAKGCIIQPGAVLGENVRIGPFCIISENVVIGKDTVIGPHSVINGLTTIGCENYIGSFSTLGEINQDLKYKDESTKLIIGDRNKFGNNITVHRGTVQGRNSTTIGHDNFFMSNVHIGHDCVVGNRTVIGVNSGLAGHVQLGDGVILGVMCAIHQFCILGAFAKIADQSGVVQDVPPFIFARGNHAVAIEIDTHSIGIENETDRELLSIFYSMLYHQALPLQTVKEYIEKLTSNSSIVNYFNWFLMNSSRGIVRP
ncbi:acyl-ACP--UDP-N-acetylglucosamine O-acyltransferase [Lelliottia sp. WAP21]|uniref:acyl-ACP--UDP-N-acetylglucosamine O-acyltransferase n=1 Tax=Lelliottia sp. WAP21 TaxID=2877426 RepID=UPI001E5336B0|nr:acyl-ACP--UDP-N-acetylglucosamine O-acyltransferase [Lelliottia sp. WAP21]